MSVTLTAWSAHAGSVAATTEPAPDPSDSPASSGFTVAGALAELPADLVDESAVITMADLDAVTAAAGITVPDGSTDDYISWLMTITGTPPRGDGDSEMQFPPAVAFPPMNLVQHAAMADELEAAVGFDLADVSWFADVSHPPSGFSVVAGAFDEATLPDTLTPVEDGIVGLGEGEDFSQRLDAPNPLSRIGVPQRLAVAEGRIAVSPDTTLVSGWLGGASGGEVDDDLVAVATALDEAGAISAVLGSLGDLEDTLGQNATPEQREQVLARLGDLGLDDQFDDAVGIGWRAGDGQPAISIVYSLDDDVDAAGAEAAVDSVRRVFEEGTLLLNAAPVPDYLVLDHVTTDGTVVVATVHPGPEGRPVHPYQMLERHDLPFVVIDD